MGTWLPAVAVSSDSCVWILELMLWRRGEMTFEQKWRWHNHYGVHIAEIQKVFMCWSCVLMVWGQWFLVTLCWHLGTFLFFMALSVSYPASSEVFCHFLISYVWPSFVTLWSMEARHHRLASWTALHREPLWTISKRSDVSATEKTPTWLSLAYGQGLFPSWQHTHQNHWAGRSAQQLPALPRAL